MHQIIEFAKDHLGITLYEGQAAVLTEYYESGNYSKKVEVIPNPFYGKYEGRDLNNDFIYSKDGTYKLRPDS